MTAIAFDLSALFVGAANDTPRGLDRVDLGFARRIFGDPKDANLGLLPSQAGMGVVTSEESRALIQLAQRRWRESGSAGEDEAFSAWLRLRLAGEDAPNPPRRRGSRSRAKLFSRYARSTLHNAKSLARPAARRLPQDCIYLNTGLVLLHFPSFFGWLARRPDIKPVFLLHDLIPIAYPEYSGPALTREYELAIETVAKRAHAIIATTHGVADEISRLLRRRGRSDLRIHVAALPVDDVFLEERRDGREDFTHPYFVIAGAIDQRKNHPMLLHVWRELARARGREAPRLVVVGARAARSNGIVEFMRSCPYLASTVIEVNGLSTPVMRELIRDARALLMPSFSEGFGLPIIEALALQTPVIASDIPAHREVGGEFAAYIDPLDAISWRDEIDRRARESEAERHRRRRALAAFRPRVWSDYFDDVTSFIDSLS